MINLAIVAPNRNKYSETFIHNHVRLLEGKVTFLFDGYLPAMYSEDRGITGQEFKTKTGITGFFNSVAAESVLPNCIKAYLQQHETDVVLAEYGPTGVEMMQICADMRIPLVVHFHGYDAYRNDILADYGERYTNLFLLAAAIICVSADMKRQLISLGCREDKIYFLPYGVDGGLFRQNRSLTKHIDFVFCGRFVAKKAPHKLLEAFRLVNTILPGTTLHMIGDGELLQYCRELVCANGLERQVTFHGVLSPVEVAEVFNRSRVYVQHSVVTAENDSEGTPLSVLEAGACGLPVIATRHAGIADVVKEGVTGYLVEENDCSAMADRMIFLASNPAVALKIGEQAAQHVSENYSLGSSIQQLQLAIKKVAGRNAAV